MFSGGNFFLQIKFTFELGDGKTRGTKYGGWETLNIIRTNRESLGFFALKRLD